ncbi:MAG TPA: tetratricopeptide repeat protein [Candidatus Didemnitutus sp.]|nr:tetratricopeptide repeat protein [Candidatus Didemnitutus sp.]
MLALACFAGLMLFFSPRWSIFAAWSRVPDMGFQVEVRRGVSVLWQMDHWGAPPQDALHGATQWRLLFPVLGKLLSLPPVVLFGLADAGCALVLFYFIRLLRQRGHAWGPTAAAAIVFGAASWYFASVCWLGYYDSWVVLGLLVVAFSRARWLIAIACLLAPWVDERFVLGVPLALLCRQAATADAWGAAGARWKSAGAVAASLSILFVVVRLGVLAGSSGQLAKPSSYLQWLSSADSTWSQRFSGIWEGWRIGWVLAGAALWPFAKSGGGRALVGGAIGLTLVVGLATAQDFSRSMMFLAPAVAWGAMRLLEAAPRWTTKGWPVMAGAALLLPAHLVMSDASLPVMSFGHEWAGLRNPPPAVMPELYELRGIQAMERGDYARAEFQLTLAIKLATNPATASKHRGLLYAGAQRWKDALEEFQRMVEYSPNDPDAWLLQAQAKAALSDAEGARADLQQALKVAPKDWEKRPDVVRFKTRLGL